MTPAPLADGVVTSLVAKRGRSERVVVHIDGARAFDLARVVVDEAGLCVGVRLAMETQERLLAEDAPYRARERALGLLALRDRSLREIAQRLQMAGYEPEVAAGAVTWLVDLGYLNDARFAAGYAAMKARAGWGGRRIRAELLSKGVDRRVVDEVLSSAGSGDDVPGEEVGAQDGREAVVALARRRFASQFRTDPEGAARRLAGYLGRRGYDWDVIRAVARLLSAEAAGDDTVPLP